jgi:hypothetical protein
MMTKKLATCLAVVLFASAVSAQHDTKTAASNISGTWNMGLQGDHVIPTALVLKHDGRKLTGTIQMPGRRIGERTEVVLDGEFIDNAITLSGTMAGAAEPTTLEIAGKLNDDGSMEGTLKSPHGKIPWTAERLKERK